MILYIIHLAILTIPLRRGKVLPLFFLIFVSILFYWTDGAAGVFLFYRSICRGQEFGP